MSSIKSPVEAHRGFYHQALGIMSLLRTEARLGNGRNYWVRPGFNVTCTMQAGKAKWTINGGRSSGERALRAIIIQLKEPRS